MRSLAVFVCILIAHPLASQAFDEKAVTKEIDKLKGRWNLVSITGAGIKLSEQELKTSRRGFVFEAEKVQSVRGKDAGGEGVYTVAPTKTPKEIDIAIGPKGDQTRRQRLQAIYKLENDRLTLCNKKPGMARPTKFAADEETMLSVFEREQP